MCKQPTFRTTGYWVLGKYLPLGTSSFLHTQAPTDKQTKEVFSWFRVTHQKSWNHLQNYFTWKGILPLKKFADSLRGQMHRTLATEIFFDLLKGSCFPFSTLICYHIDISCTFSVFGSFMRMMFLFRTKFYNSYSVFENRKVLYLLLLIEQSRIHFVMKLRWLLNENITLLTSSKYISY